MHTPHTMIKTHGHTFYTGPSPDIHSTPTSPLIRIVMLLYLGWNSLLVRSSVVSSISKAWFSRPSGPALEVTRSISLSSAWASVSDSCCSTALVMGSIMAVEAVLLIHMERKAVVTMKPIIRLGNGQRGKVKEEGSESNNAE